MASFKNYFHLLGLTETFSIFIPELEKRYFAAQRAFHPDRLTGKTEKEKTHAISHSMEINTAYEILKSPLKRTYHLLELHGITTQNLKPSPALLMEIIQIREQLDEAQTQAELHKLEIDNSTLKSVILAALEAAFASNNYSKAAELALRLSYIIKILEEIKAKLKKLHH